MSREAGLFESSNGSILEAYLLLKQEGKSVNIPPMWIERSRTSRKNIEKEIKVILKNGNLNGIHKLREWEERFKKENFYTGIRILLELERKGRTNY